MSRYARQEILIGQAGQERLRSAAVLVVGAGGLGCAALPYLVGAGIGRIGVIDGDVVGESNLHRQTLYRMTDLGKPKAQVACASLAALNPQVRFEVDEQFLSPHLAAQKVANYDVIVDAADRFSVTYMLSDVCFAAEKPLISASVLGFSGYVGGFCGGAPSYRAVFPDIPLQSGSCAMDGVLGPMVGVVGSLQAQMVLSVILGLERLQEKGTLGFRSQSRPDKDFGPSPLGRLVSVDMKGFGGFSFLGAPEPEVVSIPFIDALDVTADDVFIDVRQGDELMISPNRVVLACRSGLRAYHAARELQKMGQISLAVVALGD